jgi:hypothetical protein
MELRRIAAGPDPVNLAAAQPLSKLGKGGRAEALGEGGPALSPS